MVIGIGLRPHCLKVGWDVSSRYVPWPSAMARSNPQYSGLNYEFELLSSEYHAFSSLTSECPVAGKSVCVCDNVRYPSRINAYTSRCHRYRTSDEVYAPIAALIRAVRVSGGTSACQYQRRAPKIGGSYICACRHALCRCNTGKTQKRSDTNEY